MSGAFSSQKGPAKPEFERVSTDSVDNLAAVWRFPVPGGWIYLFKQFYGNDMSTQFVPHSRSKLSDWEGD